MDSIFLYVEKNGEITITELQEGAATTSIVIPETIDGMPVTKIAKQAFYGSPITEVTIGGNIRKIEEKAFYMCKKLSSVTWNCKCDVVPAFCFYKCTSLSKFDFSSVESIGESAFSESGLKEINLPHNIQKVRNEAFYSCKSLKAVRWNAQTKSIPMDCFRRCSSLSEFDFSSVENIGAGAFSGSGLKEVNLSHNIQKVERNAFFGCKSLKAVHWNAQTKDIPLYCFYECSSLKQFSFSDVKYLAVEAFAHSGLTSVKLSKGTAVAQGCFAYCNDLKKIEWLSDQNIKGKIFEGCKNIKEIFISDSVMDIAVDAFSSSPNAEITFV